MVQTPKSSAIRRHAVRRHLPLNIALVEMLRLGLTVLVITFGFVTYQVVTTRADDDTPVSFLIGVQGVEEQAGEPGVYVLNPGQSVQMTSVAHYATMDVPVTAVWSISDDADGDLGCPQASKSCLYTAPDVLGMTDTISATPAQLYGLAIPGIELRVAGELQNPFTDAIPEWALPAIVGLHNLGIITGYEDGSFGPSDPVTRGQIITLISRILQHAGLVQEPQNCFASYSDVPVDHYAFTHACMFRQQHWVHDYGELGADLPAPREIAAFYVNNVLGESLLQAEDAGLEDLEEEGQVFSDIPFNVNSDIYISTLTLKHFGIMTGLPNGDFGKGQAINRAAAAVVMYRILNVLEDLSIGEIAGYDPTPDPWGAPWDMPASVGGAPNQEECDGNWIDTRLSDDNCGGCNQACPDNAMCDGNGSCVQRVYGMCIAQVSNASVPPRHVNEFVGNGFAKRHLTDAPFGTFQQVKNACSPFMADLMEDYCAFGTNVTSPALWYVSVFSEQSSGTSIWSTPIEYHPCP